MDVLEDKVDSLESMRFKKVVRAEKKEPSQVDL